MQIVQNVSFSFKRTLCLILSLSLTSSFAFADLRSSPPPQFTPLSCEEMLTPISYTNDLEAFAAGEKTYGDRPLSQRLDDQTALELGASDLVKALEPYLYTDLGRRRAEFVSRNAMLDTEQIQARQNMIRYIREHSAEFEPLRQHLKAIQTAGTDFHRAFQDLGPDQTPLSLEVMYASFTILCYLAGPILGLVTEPSLTVRAFFISQGIGLGASNLLKRVRPKRLQLSPYQAQMQTVRQGLQILDGVEDPGLRQIEEALGAVLKDDRPILPIRLFNRANAAINPRDRDLLSSSAVPSDEPSYLRTIYRRLLLLQTTWSTKVFGYTIPWIDLSFKWDMFHVSNFQLRNLTQLMVDHKDELAMVWGVVADLELCLAQAAFADDHPDWNFITLAEKGAAPHLEADEAHDPMIKLTAPNDSVPNNLILGHPPAHPGAGNSAAVVVSSANNGGRTILRTAGRLSLWTQAGMPVPVKSGSLTPSIILSSLNPPISPDSRGQTYAEGRRLALIQDIQRNYPYSLILVAEPFSGAGDLRSLALRMQMIYELVEANSLVMFATRSRALISLIKDWKDVAFLRIANYRLGPFVFDEIDSVLNPAATFDALRAVGVNPDFVRGAEEKFKQLTESMPKDNTAENVDLSQPQASIPTPQQIIEQLEPPPAPMPPPRPESTLLRMQQRISKILRWWK